MPHAQDPYPGPRRPQIGPVLSGSHPTTAAGVLRTDLCPPPTRAEPCINLPARTPSPQKAASCPALPRQGSIPAPKGDPTPQRQAPAGKLCRHPCQGETFCSRPFTLQQQKVSPWPHVTTCQRPQTGISRIGLCLWQRRSAHLPPDLHLPTQSPIPLIFTFPLFPFTPTRPRVSPAWSLPTFRKLQVVTLHASDPITPHSPECPKR